MPVEIASITINSGVNLCYNEKPVVTPNWQAETDTTENHGSKRPGAFLISDKDNNFLEVELHCGEAVNPHPATLVGNMGKIQFKSAAFQPQPGKIKIQTLPPTDPPAHFTQIQGDINWRLATGSGDSTPLGKTRLEIYWLYATPGNMFKKGAWVEVLRLLANQCYHGLHSKEEIITRIVNYCHSGAGLKYDIANSTSHYTQTYWGGGFNLKAFLQETYPLCICTDLAGLVQVMLSAIGLPVDYCYTHPFGFLNNTNLIGRGQVNNTYFLGKEPAPEVVSRCSPKRWGFGSHAFCTWEVNKKEHVLDACAGPHIGHETVSEYLDAVIDRYAPLYPDKRESLGRPAEPKDVYKCTGITDVHSITCRAGLCNELLDKDKRVARFKQETRFDDFTAINSNAPLKYVECDWANPILCPAIGASWTINHQHVRGGCRFAIKEWSLSQDQERLKIHIFVSTQDLETARNQLLSIISSSPLPTIPFKRKETGPLGDFHVTAHQKELWLYHNVCFLVESYLSHINLEPICQWLQQQAATHLTGTLTGLPAFADQETDPLYIIMKNRQTQKLTVFPQSVDPKEPLLLEYFIENSIVQISAETAPTPEDPTQAYSLTLKALSPGLTDINLFLVNRRNLLCSQGVRVYCEVDDNTPS